MKLLVKFPTRGRREKFFTTLDKYRSLCEDPSNVSFLISMDSDDLEMSEELVKDRFDKMDNVYLVWGRSTSKIGACNRDIRNFQEPWDILLLASDDMVPQIQGWDTRIISDMEVSFPNTDGVLWYSDGYQAKNLNTLCILGKTYYNRFKYVYHPSYRQVWCDNEFTEVSIRLNKVVYSSDVIIRHEHPLWGFGKLDQMNIYDLGSVNEEDKSTFIKRALIQFDLKNEF